MHLNSMFDQVILSDTKYPVTHAETFPEPVDPQPIHTGQELPDELVFTDKEQIRRWRIVEVLRSPKYTEDAKIQFVRDAIASKAADGHLDRFFFYQDIRAPGFWPNSPAATAMMDNFFKTRPVSGNNRWDYLLFKAANLYPDAKEMIVEYFKARPGMAEPIFDEYIFLYNLILFGDEDLALDYLQLLVEEFLQSDATSIILGQTNSYYNQAPYDPQCDNLFVLLCLSDDPVIAEKAYSLLKRFITKRKNDREYNRLEAFLHPTEAKEGHTTLNAIEEMVARLKTYLLLPADHQLSFGKIEWYVASRNKLNWHLLRVLGEQRLFLAFFPDAGTTPVDYCSAFKQYFAPVLRAAGFGDIGISQTAIQQSKEYSYTLFLRSNECLLQTSFTDSSDYYRTSYMVKLINLALLQKRQPKRLMEIMGKGVECSYVLMEPAIAKPLLHQYAIDTFALEFDDDFHLIDKTIEMGIGY